MIGTIWELASEHLISFGLGLIAGWALTSRYRIVKREEPDDREGQ